MIFKCDCCGFAQDFADGEAAFNEGWDTEPHFFGYVACDLCPASYQFLPGGWRRHDSIHEEWEKNGRPSEFSQESCVRSEDRVSDEQLDEMRAAIQKIDPLLVQAAYEAVKAAYTTESNVKEESDEDLND